MSDNPLDLLKEELENDDVKNIPFIFIFISNNIHI